MTTDPTTRTLKVDVLARVEGEGALLVRHRGPVIEEVQLRIYEPPRLFESILRGRSQLDPPDFTARICGICPVAYLTSACKAIEDAHGLVLDPELRSLRRLLYCGEWIESHVLHVALLHAPDFLGVPDAVAIAKQHPDLVKSALRLKKLGNAIVRLLGGREIHPINVRVGGFYSTPSRGDVLALVPEIEWGLDAARTLLRAFAGFEFPDVERPWELVSLSHPTEYPIDEGRLASTGGVDADVREFESIFVEEQVPHSTALHAKIRGRGSYLTGPLARFAIAAANLSPEAKDAAAEVGLVSPCRNPYKSILVRMIEVIHALDEARTIARAYSPPKRAHLDVPTKAGVGYGASEAPRGLLYHRYTIGDDGTVLDAKIVPPTSQNQAAIEDDLRALGPDLVTLPSAQATTRAERAIRNHDPCISCSAHFLDLRLEEVGS